MPWSAIVPADSYETRADFGYGAYEFCEWISIDPDPNPCESATSEWWLETITVEDDQGNPVEREAVTIRATLNRCFADTAWGHNSMLSGWPGKGRKFKQIWTSDNLEMTLYYGDKETVAMEFGIDLLAPDGDGWKTAGVDGKDGFLEEGNRAHILAVETSMSLNLNNPPSHTAGMTRVHLRRSGLTMRTTPCLTTTATISRPSKLRGLDLGHLVRDLHRRRRIRWSWLWWRTDTRTARQPQQDRRPTASR